MTEELAGKITNILIELKGKGLTIDSILGYVDSLSNIIFLSAIRDCCIIITCIVVVIAAIKTIHAKQTHIPPQEESGDI